MVHTQWAEVISMLSVPEATFARVLSNVRTRPELKGALVLPAESRSATGEGWVTVDLENIISIGPISSPDGRSPAAPNLSEPGISTNTQLPLMLYFGIINHKSRVCPLDRAVLGIL